MYNTNFVSIFQVWKPGEQPSAIRWCDLNLIHISDPSKLKTCTVALPALSATFEKQEIKSRNEKSKQEWVKVKPAGGPTLEPSVIEPIVNTLLAMRGEDVMDPSQKEALGLSSAPYVATFSLTDGSSTELRVVQRDDRYCGGAKNGKYVYVIPKIAFNSSFGKLTGLLQAKPNTKGKSDKKRTVSQK
jgi:hypothetical protein